MPQPGQLFVWGHPIDLHFSINDYSGWPKALIKVWRLDRSNKIDACSYGTVHFPRTAGYHKVVWYSKIIQNSVKHGLQLVRILKCLVLKLTKI